MNNLKIKFEMILDKNGVIIFHLEKSADCKSFIECFLEGVTRYFYTLSITEFYPYYRITDQDELKPIATINTFMESLYRAKLASY